MHIGLITGFHCIMSDVRIIARNINLEKPAVDFPAAYNEAQGVSSGYSLTPNRELQGLSNHPQKVPAFLFELAPGITEAERTLLARVASASPPRLALQQLQQRYSLGRTTPLQQRSRSSATKTLPKPATTTPAIKEGSSTNSISIDEIKTTGVKGQQKKTIKERNVQTGNAKRESPRHGITSPPRTHGSAPYWDTVHPAAVSYNGRPLPGGLFLAQYFPTNQR